MRWPTIAAVRSWNSVDPPDALASCDKAITVEPHHDWVHNNHGTARSDLERPAEALTSCTPYLYLVKLLWHT
jgi:hypothetical protein